MGGAAAYEVHKHTRVEQPRPSSSYAFRRAHKKEITKNGGIAAVIGDCSGGVTWLRRVCNVPVDIATDKRTDLALTGKDSGVGE